MTHERILLSGLLLQRIASTRSDSARYQSETRIMLSFKKSLTVLFIRTFGIPIYALRFSRKPESV